MTLEQAIEHAEEVAIEQAYLMGRYDAASGYARSRNESIRTESAKKCEQCAAEHIQLAAWLRELAERRKAPEIVRCCKCKHKKDHHYEEPGEEPYIKSICENKYGLTKGYQVHDWDFCSRAERRTECEN